MAKKNFEDKIEKEKKRIEMKKEEVSKLEKLENEFLKRIQNTKLIHKNVVNKLKNTMHQELPSFKNLKELKIIKHSSFNYIKKF